MAELTTRDKIVSYAEAAKRGGQSYAKSADKLGIDPSTLYRYRKGRTSPSKATEKKMKRGGKLTQLLQFQRGERGGPPGPPKGEGELLDTDEAMPRPELVMNFISRTGRGLVFDEDTIREAIEVKVTARRMEKPSGSQTWEVGPEPRGEVLDSREINAAIGSVQDAGHLAGILHDRLFEQGIIYPNRRRP